MDFDIRTIVQAVAWGLLSAGVLWFLFNWPHPRGPSSCS